MVDPRVLAVARGDAEADTVLRGGRVVNVFSGDIEAVDVALAAGRVAALGPGYAGKEVVELGGAWVLPGFIDAHVHIESSLVTPPEFSTAVVPRGTTTVISDPHEIANVHGIDGIRYMLDASEDLALTVFVMASSCVPATHMSTSGAALSATELAGLLDHPRVIGLAEVMNYPGVIHGDPEVARKIAAFRGKPIDGHAPGVRGPELAAYVAGGPGSDHESTAADEALEKLRRGLFVFLREATNARNLDALLPMLSPANLRRVALCTDDRQPADLIDDGGIDHMLRRVMEAGIAPVEAIRLATLNPAEYFGLHDRGALAPGRVADIVVVDDLKRLTIREVWCAGSKAASEGRMQQTADVRVAPPRPSMSAEPTAGDLLIPVEDGRARVIVVVPDQIVTDSTTVEPSVEGGAVASDPGRDLLKIVVVERHTGSGRVGLGLVRGMGLTRGAMAGTVAHDHHNVIAIGVDDPSILTAVRAVAQAGGGLAVADGAQVLEVLPLPVGGLMSERPIGEVRDRLDAVVAAARGLGSPLHDPFMAMSFLGLEVIPTLKITDLGLVDVGAFERVDLWA